ncbi:MAG: D-aminoacylase [Dehalococcoidia bacterium]|nr:D-aminoacylase [Dehalococcoidia bacterium]
MLQLLISGGMIVDGAGNPGFFGAVGVEGEDVHIFRGDISSLEAETGIDATGKVVCPGFIDMHAHSGLVLLAEPEHHPKVRQGITTELIGVDGNSYAPFLDRADLRQFIELNSGLDGAPDLAQEWSTVAEYLSLFDRRASVNVAYIIGNAPLRICAVGWRDQPATGSQIENMRALLREGMEEGAFGISTGLDYPPGSYADTQELVQLSREAARLGGIYHTHVRNSLGDRFLDPFKEAIDIGRQSEIPCHLTHLYQRVTAPGGARKILGLVEEGREEGLDVTFDSYPYIYSSTRLLIIFPQWAQDGGPESLKEVMRSQEGRERLRKEISPRGPSWEDMWLTYFKHPHNHRFEGRSIAEIAEMTDKDEVDAVCDLLLEEDLQTSYVTIGPNGHTLPNFVTHPLSMVGSDAVLLGDFPSPRTYGTFPVILSELVREEQAMTLENAVRKMTSFPAQRLGLPDRGLLRDGMKADIVVFDPDTVKAPATRRQPKQYPIGIDYVIVNGQVVIEQGRHTGALAGRALRRGRPAT